MKPIYSNVVSENPTREVQKNTLTVLANTLEHSFGPYGSVTAIVKSISPDSNNVHVEHTKDGHTILSNIVFMHPIEQSVKETLTGVTHHVVKEVGDGTTSAVLLCKTMFDALCDTQALAGMAPADVLAGLNNVIDEINKRIMDKARPCTIDDIYNIALIATNNNEYVSKTLLRIYERYGLDAYIDVGTCSETEFIVKEYDGMTIETGMTKPCFINNTAAGTCELANPAIYVFNDPIDTPEMLNFLDTIIETNVLGHFRVNDPNNAIPTVILCKKITPDASSTLSSAEMLMNRYPGKIPLLIVSDIHQQELLEDIVGMIGAKIIRKYIDPNIQEEDIKQGLAPTINTICDFCGHAAMVRSDQFKTQVIRPEKMFIGDTDEYSEEYKSTLRYLENLITQAEKEEAGVNAIANAKRRYNSFKRNMIDLLIGGITSSDREALKAAVEDAVFNCRSAAVNGVGYGANFMAYQTISEMSQEEKYHGNKILEALYSAYKELLTILYSKNSPQDTINDILDGMLREGCPLNIRTNKYDGTVLSSIRSDVVILESIKKILGMMYTTNQYIVPSPTQNVYDGGIYSKKGD